MAYGCICIKNTNYGIRKGVHYKFYTSKGKYVIENGDNRHVYNREEFIESFSIVDFQNSEQQKAFIYQLNVTSERDFIIEMVIRSQENYPYRTIGEHLEAIKNILERPVDSLNQTIAA